MTEDLTLFTPAPKPGVRRAVKDPRVMKLYAAANPECVACGGPGANAHHVLERDNGGDDVWPNLVTLCGSGTTGCHGALHGNPYYDDRNVHVTGIKVALAIGFHLAARRHDTIGYIVGKLGPVAGPHYLRSRYFIDDDTIARISGGRIPS